MKIVDIQIGDLKIVDYKEPFRVLDRCFTLPEWTISPRVSIEFQW